MVASLDGLLLGKINIVVVVIVVRIAF